jgi:hypothetical protein
MICDACGQSYIGRHAACPHCGAVIGNKLITAPTPQPSEAAEPVWRNMAVENIVHPSFLAQSAPPSYRTLRWIRDDKVVSPVFVAAGATGEIMVAQVPQRERWRINRAIYIGPTANTVFRLYAGASSYGAANTAYSDLFDVGLSTAQGSFMSGNDLDSTTLAAGSNIRATFAAATAADQIAVILYIDVYVLEVGQEMPEAGDTEGVS